MFILCYISRMIINLLYKFYIHIDPTLSLGINLRSAPCFKNIFPAV